MTYSQPPVQYGAPQPQQMFQAPPVVTYSQSPASYVPPPVQQMQPVVTYGQPQDVRGMEGMPAFDQLDANHDGVISRAEFEAMMAQQQPQVTYGAPQQVSYGAPQQPQVINYGGPPIIAPALAVARLLRTGYPAG